MILHNAVNYSSRLTSTFNACQLHGLIWVPLLGTCAHIQGRENAWTTAAALSGLFLPTGTSITMSFITLPSPTVIGLVIAFAAVLLYFKGRRRYLDDIRGPKSGSWLYGTSHIATIASCKRRSNDGHRRSSVSDQPPERCR